MNHIFEKLKETKKPIIVENILPRKSNIAILNLLTKQKWQIASDDNQCTFEAAYENNKNHLGWLYCSADPDTKKEELFNSPLNVFAFIITDIISKTLDFDIKKIHRFMWNYYNAKQEGVNHKDMEEESYLSIIYSLHTTDGGTIINDKFYQDKESQAKIFMSNWIHKGMGTKNDKARSNLNIIMET